MRTQELRHADNVRRNRLNRSPEMHYYQLYGLNILSELRFPELTEIPWQNNQDSDITIRFGTLSHEGLIDPDAEGFSQQFNEKAFWLDIKNIGLYLIEAGRSIIIDPHESADEDSIRAFILEPCIAILLTQRELFVLHGNTLHINGKNIAILGNYGCGKSTLSAAFLQKGHSILSDGLCVMNQQLECLSGYPCLQLWQDAATALYFELQGYRKIRPQINKFAIPLANNLSHQQQMIHAIFILNLYKKEDFRALSLLGSDKIMHLQKQIYNKKYVSILKKNNLYFDFFIKLAKTTPITLISRPIQYFRVHELAEFIQETGNLI